MSKTESTVEESIEEPTETLETKVEKFDISDADNE
jgi:hypothetical protein